MSDYIRKNPMTNSWVIDNYSKDLKVLFKNFKNNVSNILEETKIKQYAYNLPSIALKLRLSAQDNIIAVGGDVVRKNIEIGYRQGVQKARMNLRKVNIKNDGMLLKADWRAIDALQVRNLSALRGISDETNKQIIQSLTEGMKNGEDYRRLAQRLTDSIDNFGINRAEIMARTETAFTHNQAAEMRYAQNGIEKVEWFASYTENTCDACSDLDGQVFNINESWERPPLHPRCMCTIAPVLE